MGKKRATEKKEKDFDVNEFLKENEIEVDPELLQMFNDENQEIKGKINDLNQLKKKGRKNKSAAVKVQEPNSSDDGQDLNSDEEKELNLYLEMLEKGNSVGVKAEGQDDSDSESEQDENELVEKVYENQITALLSRMSDIAASPDLPWSERMVIDHEKETAASVPDVNDDLKRELAFYQQALEAAQLGRDLVLKAKIAFSRPADYFAEMVKSDQHMEKVRQNLLDQEKDIIESEKAKKQRELKKFGKKVQVEKLQERQKQKRQTLEKVKGIRRKGISNDEDFDVDVEEGTSKTVGKPFNNKKRDKKNQKYGFGGSKRNVKSNTRDSTNDISSFSVTKMKGKHSSSGRVDESDDDSESDLEIVLNADEEGLPKETVPKEQPKALVGLPIPKLDSNATVAPTIKAGLDIEAMGKLDGIDIIDVDLDSFEDKPWRKPGADLTDYFNFGFNEQTWKAYCAKQKVFREDLAQQKRHIFDNGTGNAFPFNLKGDQAGAAFDEGKYSRKQSDSSKRDQVLGKRPRDSRDDDRDGDLSDSYDPYDVTQKRSSTGRPGSAESLREKDYGHHRDRSPRRNYSKERSRDRSPPRRERSPPRRENRRRY